MSGGLEASNEPIDEVINRYKLTYDIIRSDPHHLLLDIDTDAQFLDFVKQRDEFETVWGKFEDVQMWKSRNGHKHIYITLSKPLESASLRYALQASLGSDPMREVLGVRRLKRGEIEPSILFKPK